MPASSEVLPLYKPILKWVRQQKMKSPEEREYLQDLVPPEVLHSFLQRKKKKVPKITRILFPEEIPKAVTAYMYRSASPTSTSYEKEFPPLGDFSHEQYQHKSKIPTPIRTDAHGNPKLTTTAEQVLNWQTENFVAQNKVLSKISSSVTSLSSKVDQLDTKADMHHQQTSDLLRIFQRRLKEIQDSPPASYFQMDIENKEAEIKNCETK